MAGEMLGSYVHITKEDGSVVVLEPGQAVPDWAAEIVTNPKAFADQTVETESEDESEEEESGGYADLDVEGLKSALKDRELPVSGTKPELIARLEQDDAEKEGSGSEENEE